MVAKVQFSLRMIFVVTAAVALMAAEATVFPDWIAKLVGIAVTLLLPSAFVAQIVYLRGADRAFGIGALSVWLAGTAWLSVYIRGFGVPYEIIDRGRIHFCAFWILTLAGGGVAVLVRWMSVSQPPQ